MCLCVVLLCPFTEGKTASDQVEMLQFQIPIGTISTAVVTITSPLIVLVVIFQKRIVAGLRSRAEKHP